MPDLRDFVTTEEAARILQFHVEHVRRRLPRALVCGSISRISPFTLVLPVWRLNGASREAALTMPSFSGRM